MCKIYHSVAFDSSADEMDYLSENSGGEADCISLVKQKIV